MKQTKVVNLYSGPGVGKSTTAAAVFAELKYCGVNCEYVQEPAKWASWERRGEKYFKDQVYLFAEQNWKFGILKDEVDIIVTDSPLFLGDVYKQIDFAFPSLRSMMVEAWKLYDNLDVFLVRDLNRGYNTAGRSQDEAAAIEKDHQVKTLLDTVLPHYKTLEFSRDTPNQIIEEMILRGWHHTIPALLNHTTK